MAKSWLLLSRLAPLAVVFATASVAGDATAADDRVVLGEITTAHGVAYDALQSAASAEIGALDTSKIKRKVIVSISVLKNEAAPYAISISALVRDRKTGNMLAVVSGNAKSEGTQKSTRENVLRAAVHSALCQIPQAAR